MGQTNKDYCQIRTQQTQCDLINRQDKKWTIVKFYVPWDKNVLLKEEEKIEW